MSVEQIYISEDVKKVKQLHLPIIEARKKDTTVKQELLYMVENLKSAHQTGLSAAAVEIRNWHPIFVGQPVPLIMNSKLEEYDFRIVIAREYGFDTWAQVETWGNQLFNPLFEETIDDMLSGYIDNVKFNIQNNPNLIWERSPYNHRATLLHYVGSNGIEIRRQQVPLNLPRLTKLLLESGADVSATAYLYGTQCTALELLASSAHPEDAGIREEMIGVLRANA